MFNINDVIVYGSNGVCKIEGIENKELMGTKKQYFVLKPIKGNASTYFVPIENDKLLAKMRKLLSVKEVNELIDSMVNKKANWITNENERREKYRAILCDGNPLELIKIIKAIFIEKKEREANGKRLHASDERFFRDAERLSERCSDFSMETVPTSMGWPLPWHSMISLQMASHLSFSVM